ncbi:MAG: G5 domain-containing protein [Clostridiales bacterium]|jgi:3D (Asp-Asp-Asp) domain-containing protein|nr:G5 domain-containing protein [Clostridiales bacterium]
MNKTILYRVFVGAMTTLAIFFMGADTYEGASFGIVLVDNGYTRSIDTEQETVLGLMDELGFFIHEFDVVSPALNFPIHRGMVIEIERAFPVFIRLDGNPELIPFYARPGAALVTIAADFGNLFDNDNEQIIFDTTVARHRPEPGEIIDLLTIGWATRAEYEPLPFEREYVESFLVPVGETAIYREGAPGLRRMAFQREYLAGQLVYEGFLSDSIVRQPLSEIVHIGVPLPPNTALSACGQAFTYSRMVLMESTAYTLSVSCTGRTPDHPWWGITASGMQAQVGVVAVDTNVIPFHTRMYIEGYGFAVAGDRGGAIRGYKVDVFLDTMAEVRQWGRRHNVRVWILE